MPIVDVTQELKSLVKEKETPNEYNWGVPANSSISMKMGESKKQMQSKDSHR